MPCPVWGHRAVPCGFAQGPGGLEGADPTSLPLPPCPQLLRVRLSSEAYSVDLPWPGGYSVLELLSGGRRGLSLEFRLLHLETPGAAPSTRRSILTCRTRQPAAGLLNPHHLLRACHVPGAFPPNTVNAHFKDEKTDSESPSGFPDVTPQAKSEAVC